MDLHAAARRLGVHYQTAYKWVRDGSLVAVKRGASYDLDEEEVERFLAVRQAPAPPPRTTTVRDWDAQVDRFHASLLRGDELGTRMVVDRLHDGGVEPLVIMEELFAPALARIGREWASGEVSVAAEHRASATCERMLVRVGAQPRGRPRGVAIVTTPPGDEHSLPASMATVALRADRWQVHHLGTQTPIADLVTMVDAVSADLVVISLTNPAAAGSADDAETALAAGPARVLVGGPGHSLRQLLDAARLGTALD